MITTGTGKSLFEEEKYERGSDSPKESEDEDDVAEAKGTARVPVVASGRTLTGRIAVKGAMKSEERDDSLDSDIDLEGEEDASDLDSEDELELMNLASKTSKDNARPTTTVKKQTDSDDDF